MHHTYPLCCVPSPTEEALGQVVLARLMESSRGSVADTPEGKEKTRPMGVPLGMGSPSEQEAGEGEIPEPLWS